MTEGRKKRLINVDLRGLFLNHMIRGIIGQGVGEELEDDFAMRRSCNKKMRYKWRSRGR